MTGGPAGNRPRGVARSRTGVRRSFAGLCVLTMAVGAIDIIGTAFFGLPPRAYRAPDALVASALLASHCRRRKVAPSASSCCRALPGRARLRRARYALTAVFWGFVAWHGWSSIESAPR
jgi:hypothetical protein